jgi:hypothetical protein
MNCSSNSSNRISALAIAVICVGLLCLFVVDISHAKKNKEDSPYFNKELSRLSYGLALLDANAAFVDQRSCVFVREIASTLEKSDQGKPGDDDDLSRHFELRKQEEREWCDIFTEVARDTKDIAATALQTQAVPTNGYLLYARRSEPLFEDENSKESLKAAIRLGKFPPSPEGEPVGLFKTLEGCQTAEARLRNLDSPTRPCRPWMNSWLAKVKAPKSEEIEAAHRVDYEKVAWAAVVKLLGLGALVVVYLFSRHMFSSSSPISSRQRMGDYLKCAGGVAVLSVTLWATYGSHFESEDTDPIHGTGEWVQDFNPTDKERNEHGLETFLILLIPAWLGVRKAHEAAPLFSPRVEEAGKAFDRIS